MSVPRHIAVIAITTALSACNTSGSSEEGGFFRVLGLGAPFLTSVQPERGVGNTLRGREQGGPSGYTDLGQETIAGSGQRTGDQVQLSDDGSKVTLNFVNVELQEFVRAVFDEILKESVVVDPNLNGRVTVRTTDAVTRTAALNLVRNVLHFNGATVAKSAGVFRVAARGSGPTRGQIGENVRIVPVRYLNPDQARSALQPFSGQGTEIAANADGRYLVLSGASTDLDSLTQVLDTLDVDHMQGMSFALMPLRDANASSVSSEILLMFGQGNSGALRAIPIQRMNAVLLMTRTPQTLARAKDWIERLDQSGQDGRQVRVFPIQNRRATDLAQILNGILNSRNDQPTTDKTITPPSLTPSTAQTAPIASASGLGARVQTASAFALSILAPSSSDPTPNTGGSSESVSIKADVSTNSLVVRAEPEQYRLIESAIRRLDVLPTQVLIEATIAEVSSTTNSGTAYDGTSRRAPRRFAVAPRRRLPQAAFRLQLRLQRAEWPPGGECAGEGHRLEVISSPGAHRSR